MVVGFLGVRALVIENELAEQEIQRRLEATADDVELGIRQELLEWQRTVELWTPDSANWPERLRVAAAEPGQIAVLREIDGRVRVFPGGQVPYELESVKSAPVLSGSLWARAETAELRDKEYVRALALYRRLLAEADEGQRQAVLHRLARCARKAGRELEARSWFRQLAKAAPVRIGTLPSDLLARYEIASTEADLLALYEDLVAGRWELDKVSYYFYSASIRERLHSPETVRKLREVEEKKLALGEAAERFLDEPVADHDGPHFLVFQSQEPLTAIVLSESFVRSVLLPAALRSLSGRDVLVAVSDHNGNSLYGGDPPEGAPTVMRSVSSAGLIGQIRAWLRDSTALYENANRRRNLYLGIFGGILGLLVFGGYLTLHTARAEMAMAQLKSDFVSTVSHEFRSPLTGVHQLAEMLRDGRVPDEGKRRQYYEMIVNETQRLRRLVENVLDFSRIEEGRKKYTFEAFDPAGWLRELAGEFQGEVAARGFQVETEIPETLPVMEGDREALGTAVRNLLDNAVKYSGDSKTVWLASSGNGSGLSISVRDQGVGIEEEDRAQIFDRFYRSNSIQGTVKGVGLGLNLVRSIVAAHGGTVGVESRPGGGSEFTIRLRTGNS